MFKGIRLALLALILSINHANASIPLPSGEMPFKVDTKNRKMLVCNYFGLELQKQGRSGQYNGSISRRMIGNDLIYCLIVFINEHPNGYVSQVFYSVTGNTSNGTWEAKMER